MRPLLGILALDTTFHRPLGDAGSPESWPFPVIIERVHGAYAKPVVQEQFSDVDPFVVAGQRLIDRGASAIITTCGFLVRQPRALQKALSVPTVTSTLTQHRRLQNELAAQLRLAILTIDAVALNATVRSAADIDPEALVFSLPDNSHFVAAILHGTEPLNIARAESEWVDLARNSLRHFPDIGGWLFECANVPPYSAAVTQATGLRVYDALTLGCELHAGLVSP